MASPLTGARPLLKVAMRQDVRNIAPWVFLISVLSASSILGYRWIFPETSDRAGFAVAIQANPALKLVFGPAHDLMTNDGFNAWRAGMLGAMFAGLMGILIVIRNSRADEDSGRAELIASGVITRQARLVVAVLMAVIAAVALFVVCFLFTWASGGDPTATLVLSATFAASAIMFAGIAAVAAQLGAEARTASSIAIGTLGVLYVVRGYLDSTDSPAWTAWATPFGWLAKTAPAADNNGWPLLLALALAVVSVALALWLQERRDFGLGMVVPQPGPAESTRMSLGHLALRLNRGSILVWLAGFAFLGLAFGNLATSIGSVIADNPAMTAIIASGAARPEDLSFAFVATILHIAGIIAAVMGAQIMMRVHAEEVDHRVEPLLAGAVDRRSYLGSTVALALGSTAVAMLTVGAVLGFVASRGTDEIAFGDVVRQALVTVPAVWVLVAVSVATIGAEPSRRIAGWLVIVATFGITLLGPTFKLPDWALGFSALYHVPVVTMPDPSWVGLAALLAVAAVLLTVGLVGFRRRDIA